jgi:beta-lactamase class A
LHRTVNEAVVEALLAGAGLGGASAIVEPLDGGAPPVRLRAEAEIYPASMIKVPIAVILARRFAAGSLLPGDSVTVEARQLTSDDAPSPFVEGYRTSLAAYAGAMLSRSNNVATNVLIDTLGRESITRDCFALGLRATAVRRKLSGSLPLIDDPEATGRNVHPADDAARLFERIANEAGSSRNWIYEALRAQIWNEKLARGWRADDVFAHKTGDTDETSHDGGILTVPDGRRYVIVVYTTLGATPETAERFTDFARALRPLLGS